MTRARPTMPRNVTGRDDAIINKALAYAITTIKDLPKVRQEWSDCEDMRAMLEARLPNTTARDWVMQGVRQHIGLDPLIIGRKVGHLTVVK